MLHLAIKILIILLGILGTRANITDVPTFIFLLIAVTITGINQYYQNKKLTLFLTALYSIIALFFTQIQLFLPILLFDLVAHLPKKTTFFMPFIFLISITDNHQNSILLLFLSFLTLTLAHLTNAIEKLEIINKDIQDANASQKKSLTLKNQLLLESQGDALHMTKLQERNRIARDIHDTIGHSLSRALLQTGALSAINQNDSLTDAIDDLKITLTDAMNAIRNSIHDLKDEALDLKSAITDILNESGYKTSFSYDLTTELSNEIKNTILIILKESLTNTRKHSDATHITVTIIEHPAIYQFLVADNGKSEPTQTSHGIGLKNIQERISELGGYCRMSYDSGFKTFITIPRAKEHNEK